MFIKILNIICTLGLKDFMNLSTLTSFLSSSKRLATSSKCCGKQVNPKIVTNITFQQTNICLHKPVFLS